MNTRRKFLQQSGAFALAGLFSPSMKGFGSLLSESAKWPIGLQLYTLGDLMVNDPKGTLQKLASIGYKELESASSAKGNFYGFSPKEFAAMCKDAGLHWRSAHVGSA